MSNWVLISPVSSVHDQGRLRGDVRQPGSALFARLLKHDGDIWRRLVQFEGWLITSIYHSRVGWEIVRSIWITVACLDHPLRHKLIGCVGLCRQRRKIGGQIQVILGIGGRRSLQSVVRGHGASCAFHRIKRLRRSQSWLAPKIIPEKGCNI